MTFIVKAAILFCFGVFLTASIASIGVAAVPSLKNPDFGGWQEDSTCRFFDYSVGDTLWVDNGPDQQKYGFSFLMVVSSIKNASDTVVYDFEIDSTWFGGKEKEVTYFILGKNLEERDTVFHVKSQMFFKKIDKVRAYKVGNDFYFPFLVGEYKLPVVLTKDYVKQFEYDSLLLNFVGLPQFKMECVGLCLGKTYLSDGKDRYKYNIYMDPRVKGIKSAFVPGLKVEFNIRYRRK